MLNTYHRSWINMASCLVLPSMNFSVDRNRFYVHKKQVCTGNCLQAVGYLNLCRTYLSNEFKSIVEKRFEISPIDESHAQYICAINSSCSTAVDATVNNLTSSDVWQANVCDQFLELRSKNGSTSVLEPTIYAVLTHCVVTGSTQDLLYILQQRLHYGVFLDKYIGCYLMDHLLKTNSFAAAQVAVEVMLQEDFDNDLIIAFSIKSCFDYLKEFVLDSTSLPEESSSAQIETKIRVKYIRNLSVNELESSNKTTYLIGKTLQSVSDKCSNEINVNIKVLGLLLCKNYNEIATLLRSQPRMLFQDVLSMCLALIKKCDPDQANLINMLKGETKAHLETDSLERQLSLFINAAIKKEEQKLIENIKKEQTKWMEKYNFNLCREVKQISKALRYEKAENMIKDVNVKNQRLWFFEMKDDTDLKIFHKRPTYLKKWFGKKKCPKVIDIGYVPPEIARKSRGIVFSK